MYKITLIFLALLILCGYIYFSNPGAVVINEKGRVEGLVNKARSLIQRDRFWKLQLKMANEINSRDLAPQLPSSAEMQELYRKFREVETALDDKMKPLYTREEQIAQSLRIKADSIERTGKWRLIDDAAETLRVKEAEKFKIIIPIIEAKLHIVKPQPAQNPN
jgi:hypothetical protein